MKYCIQVVVEELYIHQNNNLKIHLMSKKEQLQLS